jgi:CheY-like chemotaxis protein
MEYCPIAPMPDSPSNPPSNLPLDSASDSAAPFFFEAPPSRVLLIASDATLADTLCDVLENAGYHVGLATDGQYGLMVAADFAADVVILDTELEPTTSMEVAQSLKTMPLLAAHYRHVPILYLASQGLLLNQRFHQHPGTPISDYIFKPVNETLLIERVRRALEDNRPHAD